jgi:hypothetical protein
MRPLDFILYHGDSEPNTPINKIAEAMERGIAIFTSDNEFEVVGYFYDSESGRMILELDPKSKDEVEE